MKKVLMIVLNNFVNDSRIIKEANTLGKNGYEVLVLALHKDGLKLKEDFDFFKVERLHLVSRNRLSNKNPYIQLVKYIEFYHKCINIAKSFKPDIVHCHDMSSLPIGRRIQRLFGSKFIYDSHELWSHMSNNSKHSKLFVNLKNRIESKIAIKADLIITVSDSIAIKMKEQFALKNKPIVIRNIPLKKQLTGRQDLLRQVNNIDDDQKILLYQGGVEKGRGIETLIHSIPMINKNVTVVILGNGSYIGELKKLVSQLNIENRVFFNDAVDQKILIDYTNSADLGITLTENTCLNHYYSLPNKIFEYIQGGIPILCSNFPEMNNLISEYGVGVSVDPINTKDIADEVNNLLSDSERLKKYTFNCIKAKEILNWENEQKILIHNYDNLLI